MEFVPSDPQAIVETLVFEDCTFGRGLNNTLSVCISLYNVAMCLTVCVPCRVSQQPNWKRLFTFKVNFAPFFAKTKGVCVI